MLDMLAAYHLVRYFEQLEKEQEPYRDCLPEPQPSLAISLFRRLQASTGQRKREEAPTAEAAVGGACLHV